MRLSVADVTIHQSYCEGSKSQVKIVVLLICRFRDTLLNGLAQRGRHIEWRKGWIVACLTVLLYSNANLHNLVAPTSDHFPLLQSTAPVARLAGRHQFRFENG
ncbi:hypothetical protein LINGRAHAP2_LOCUS10836 [Linum grandiflorum]